MLKRVPLYLLTFAFYPPLALLSENIREVEAAAVLRPLLATLLVAGLAFAVFRAVLRDHTRAALAALFLLLLFFSYGHVYHLLEAQPILGVNLGRHRVLLPVYAGLLVFGLWRLIRQPGISNGLTRSLNLASLILLAIPLGRIAAVEALLTRSAQEAISLASSAQRLSVAAGDPLPDIYYIILDTYSRRDIMQREYGLDNEPFLQELRQLGFVVAECSRANYGATHTSLASALSLEYLPGGRRGEEPLTAEALSGRIKHSVVRGSLELLGYKTVAFDTGFEWTRLTDADYYLGPGMESLDLQRLAPLDSLFLKSTAILALADARKQALDPASRLVNYPYQGHIQRQLFILDHLPRISAIAEPTFTFAHVLIPHVPHVFAADGSILLDPGYYGGRGGGAVDSDYWRAGYVNGVQFANRQLLEIVGAILASSPTPPIIVLQGDTGVYPSGDDSGYLSILNAFYLPHGLGGAIYPAISPVNTFRTIFDSYFATSYGLLADEAYMDAASVSPVPETSPACQPSPTPVAGFQD